MKRFFIVAALGATALVPAASSADTAGQATTARGGQDLSIPFVVRYIGNKPVEIRNFRFKNFTVTCAVGGPKDVKGEIESMKVNDRGKFDGNARKGDGKVHVEGDVKRSGKVVGFLKATGKFGTAEGCNTKVNWVAPPN
jgi:hypothetical protein